MELRMENGMTKVSDWEINKADIRHYVYKHFKTILLSQMFVAT